MQDINFNVYKKEKTIVIEKGNIKFCFTKSSSGDLYFNLSDNSTKIVISQYSRDNKEYCISQFFQNFMYSIAGKYHMDYKNNCLLPNDFVLENKIHLESDNDKDKAMDFTYLNGDVEVEIPNDYVVLCTHAGGGSYSDFYRIINCFYENLSNYIEPTVNEKKEPEKKYNKFINLINKK